MQGGEFEVAFVALLKQFAVASRVAGPHAPWQLAVGERRGPMLGHALQAGIAEQGSEGLQVRVCAAAEKKKAAVTRDGYTPNQRVFGMECSWLAMTDEELGLSSVEALGSNTEVGRARAE